MSSSKIKGVCLDVTGTLLKFKGHIGDIYCLSAKRCGEPCPDYNKIANGFKLAYKETSELFPCFGHDEITSKTWWRICVRLSFKYAGYHYDREVYKNIFNRIYSQFGSHSAYIAYSDSAPFLKWAKSQDLITSVISNGDERYSDSILPMLGLYDDTDYITLSKDVGFEKPDSRIFTAAMQKVPGNFAPHEFLMIGDNVTKDYLGAKSAGMQALILDRFGNKDADNWRKMNYPVCTNFDEVKNYIIAQKMIDEKKYEGVDGAD